MTAIKKHISNFFKVVTGIGMLGVISYTKEYLNAFATKLHLPSFGYRYSFVAALCLAIVIYLFLVLIGWFKGEPKSFSGKRIRQARIAYLKYLEQFVDNRLLNSIQEAVFIDLQLEDSSDRVSSLEFVQRDRFGEPKQLDSLDELLRRPLFKVLLLGSPGGGKTTTLLHQLSNCLHNAKKLEEQPIPVFANLADWGKSRRPSRSAKADQRQALFEDAKDVPTSFERWLAKTVAHPKKGNVPGGIMLGWLVGERVCLFLDGLDEAEEAKRVQLVDQLNKFLKARPGISVVICSRTADYDALVTMDDCRLHLDYAVSIKPYTEGQLKFYLAHMQLSNRTALQHLLEQDQAMMEMAHSPLDLNIMVLASAHRDFSSLLEQQGYSQAEKRIALFDLYVLAMLERQPRRKKRDPQHPENDLLRENVVVHPKVIQANYRYLGWIAQLLSCHLQYAFATSQIHAILTEKNDRYDRPDELQERPDILLVSLVFICSGLLLLRNYPFFLVAGLLVATGIFMWATRRHSGDKKATEKVIIAVAGLPIVGLLAAAAGTVLFALQGRGNGTAYLVLAVPAIFALLLIQFQLSRRKEFGNHMRKNYPYYLIWLVAIIFAVMMNVVLKGRSFMEFSMIYVAGWVTFFMHQNRRQVHWRQFRSAALAISLPLYAMAAIFGGIYFFTDHHFILICLFEVAMALYITHTYRMFGNAKIGLAIGTVVAVLLGLAVPGPYLLIAGPLAMAAAALLFAFVVRRGYDGFANGVTVLFLKLQRCLPLRFQAFLKRSVSRLLLQEINGEYAFIHRRVRDHFAIRSVVPKLNAANRQQRLAMVRELLTLNDASCDVLLELIDDEDPAIRSLCISGLGDIGTKTAAQRLIAILDYTTGDLYNAASAALAEVSDITAVDTLLSVINKYPVVAKPCQHAVMALIRLHSLPLWKDTTKMRALYQERTFWGDEADCLQFELMRREAQANFTPDAVLEMTKLYGGYELLQQDLDKYLAEQDIDVLINHPKHQLAAKAFEAFFKVAPERSLTALFTSSKVYDSNMLQYIAQAHLPAEALTKSARNLFGKNKHQRDLVCFFNSHFEDETGFKAIRRLIRSSNPQFRARGLDRLENRSNKRDHFWLGCWLRLSMLCYNLPFNFMVKKLVENMASASLSERTDVLKIFIQFRLKRRKEYLLAFFKDERNAANFPHMIYIVNKHNPPGDLRMLTDLVKDGESVPRAAALNVLGKTRSKKSIGLLTEIFGAGEEVNLPLVIGALIENSAPVVMTDIVRIFEAYPDCRELMIAKLIKINAVRELIQLTEKVQQLENATAPLGMTLLAAFNNVQGNRAVALQLFLRPEILRASRGCFPGNYILNDLRPLREIVLKTEEELSSHFCSVSWCDDRKPYSMYYSKPFRRSVAFNLDIMQIDVEIWHQLDKIGGYDEEVLKWFIQQFLTGGSWQADEAVSRVFEGIKAVPEKEVQQIIAAICRLDEPAVAAVLQNFFDHADPALAAFAISCHSDLKKAKRLPAIYKPYIEASSLLVVEAALTALWKLDQDFKVPELLQRIRTEPGFRYLLTQGFLSRAVRQLSFEEIDELAREEDKEIRYFAVLSFGHAGYGRAIKWLQVQLNDHQPLKLPDNFSCHQTMSQAALFALQKIGSPSAKRAIEEWQNKKLG
ncbi:MAG: HEAT repeat domain-containing protein [Bacteroidota bacterium]